MELIFPLKTRYLNESRAKITFGRYEADDSLAMRLLDADTDEPLATATVCLADYRVKVPPGQLLIKDCRENEGIVSGLETAGIVQSTGAIVHYGIESHAEFCTLTPEAEELLKQESDPALYAKWKGVDSK